MIEEMVNDFKTTLWKYYALFMMLLNKSRYVNVVARNHHLPQWDRLALLLFISVMRMRNKKLFSWIITAGIGIAFKECLKFPNGTERQLVEMKSSNG